MTLPVTHAPGLEHLGMLPPRVVLERLDRRRNAFAILRRFDLANPQDLHLDLVARLAAS